MIFHKYIDEFKIKDNPDYQTELEWLDEFNIFPNGVCNREFILFKKSGVACDNYNIILRNFYIHFTHQTLKLGNKAQLRFSQFTLPIIKIIAFGGINMIVEYQNRIYRINQRVEAFEEKELYLETLHLLSPIIPIVKLLEVGINNEYLVVEKLNIEFTLQQYFLIRDRINSEEIKKIDLELLNFAKLTVSLVYVDDLHQNNIVYTSNKNWIVIDFISSNTTRKDKLIEYYDRKINQTKHIFFYFQEIINSKIYQKINNIIQSKRLSN